MIEVTFTREELRHLYDVLLRNHLQVKQSVMNKISVSLNSSYPTDYNYD